MSPLLEQIARIKGQYMASDNKALKRLIGSIMAGDIAFKNNHNKIEKNCKRDTPQ